MDEEFLSKGVDMDPWDYDAEKYKKLKQKQKNQYYDPNRYGGSSSGYDSDKYNQSSSYSNYQSTQNGYSRNDYQRTNNTSAQNSYNNQSYNRQSYDNQSYNRQGYNKQSYNQQGYNNQNYKKTYVENYKRDIYEKIRGAAESTDTTKKGQPQLILAILSFMLIDIPIVGIVITIVTIILSIIHFRDSNGNLNMQSVIAIAVCGFAIMARLPIFLLSFLSDLI